MCVGGEKSGWYGPLRRLFPRARECTDSTNWTGAPRLSAAASRQRARTASGGSTVFAPGVRTSQAPERSTPQPQRRTLAAHIFRRRSEA